MTCGLVVNEPAILATARGVSTIATSWWMDFKTIHPFSVTALESSAAGCVYFVACRSPEDALRLQQIMVTVGRIPGYAVGYRCVDDRRGSTEAVWAREISQRHRRSGRRLTPRL